ncbi:MAG: hypothetical protein OXI43_07390 [Candidatus Poribacteria bacterium]|nr:hypothetical protein [Candidatus Poribacteria bacterium]
MKAHSTFRILALLITLLIFSSHAVFGRVPRSTKPEVGTKQTAVLLIGDHEGIDETDAQNAALLVTEELRAQGITVNDPVHETPAGATVYRVVLRRSDKKILFRLIHEDSIGTTLTQREMLLADIEKIASVAPRLVYALVHQKRISSSPVLVNACGFITVVPPKEFLPGPGVGIGLSIDRLSYAVDVGFQIARMETGYYTENDIFNFRSGMISGRYFFNKLDMSPYVGGGIAATFVKYTTTSGTRLSGFDEFASKLGGGDGWRFDENSERSFGIGAYGILGMEVGRYSQFPRRFELRVDRPFFKLPNQSVMLITLGIVGSFSF